MLLTPGTLLDEGHCRFPAEEPPGKVPLDTASLPPEIPFDLGPEMHGWDAGVEVQEALSLSQRIVTTAELMAPPGVEVAPLHAAQGSVSVSGRVRGPVAQVSVYRGLPSAGVCRGKALATVAAGKDGRFALSVPARGANLCVAPKPFGQAVGAPIG